MILATPAYTGIQGDLVFFCHVIAKVQNDGHDGRRWITHSDCLLDFLISANSLPAKLVM